MRKASKDDFVEILRMGRLFCDAMGEKFDRESAVQTCENLLEAPDGVIFITDGGMAGALVYPMFFNHRIRQCQEAFWWVDPDKRGSGIASNLMTALEGWAKKKGAHRMVMINVASLEGERVAQIYRKKGYRPYENTFTKDL